MFIPITAATIEFNAQGQPYSPIYDDIYHATDGALGQARAVFIDGNYLPQRWQGQAQFTIVETGFGLGLNFLATWQLLRQHPQPPQRLFYYAVDKHPPEIVTLRQFYQSQSALAELQPMFEELIAKWPALLPGMHCLHLDEGRIRLNLYFGEADKALAQMQLRADSFYLDGFVPPHNPVMWSARVCHLLARMANADARLATWCVAKVLRRNLQYAGFETERPQGFANRRNRLEGKLSVAAQAHQERPLKTTFNRTTRVAIIGAGLAGCTLANRLGERGIHVQLIDQHQQAAMAASGNIAGVIRPQPSFDDNPISQLSCIAYSYLLAHIKQLEQTGQHINWQQCGAVYLARDEQQQEQLIRLAENYLSTPEFLHYLTPPQLQALLNAEYEHGGCLFPQGGWIDPASLCQANLATTANLHCLFGQQVSRITWQQEQWQLFDEQNQLLTSADELVLASGASYQLLAHLQHGKQGLKMPLRPARGQVSYLIADASAPPLVICRGGYLTPTLPDGRQAIGASFIIDDESLVLREEEHTDNLRLIAKMQPGKMTPNQLDPAQAGRTGLRSTTPDRMPISGALTSQMHQLGGNKNCYLLNGLGARGIVWSALLAEHLASQICGEPLPLTAKLANAVRAERFKSMRVIK